VVVEACSAERVAEYSQRPSLVKVADAFVGARRTERTLKRNGALARVKVGAAYSTVTDFARLRGLSTSQPRSHAM
jgi:hypothetical protein